MMKVLHILHELKFSGAEIMYVDAAPFFQNKGCELTVMATSKNKGEYASHFEHIGYEVVHSPYPVGKNLLKRFKYYRNFVQLLKKSNFDMVHIHVHAYMWAFAFCTWIARKRSVYTFHSVFTSNYYSYLYHIIQRWTAKHILNCRFQTISDSVYENELNYYRNKTKKIYNWYGSDRFFPADIEEKKQIRNELNISDDTLVLISIGGCSHIKRHTEIIKALPKICSNYPSTIYLHLGKGETEEEEQKLAVKLGVSENIRFMNNQNDVRRFLVASDIYVMSSKHEGIPITTIEAMACGIPAVLYDVPGLRDFNKHGENSLLISEDYNLLAEKILYLFSNSDISHQIAGRAKELVNKTYSLNKNALEVYQLYLNK